MGKELNSFPKDLVGNLSDFQPLDHEVDIDSLPSLDKYMLKRLHSVMSELDGSLSSFQFYRFSQALQNFIINDLSTFYFDIAKDRLYVAAANSKNRRCCQTVLYKIVTPKTFSSA